MTGEEYLELLADVESEDLKECGFARDRLLSIAPILDEVPKLVKGLAGMIQVIEYSKLGIIGLSKEIKELKVLIARCEKLMEEMK